MGNQWVDLKVDAYSQVTNSVAESHFFAERNLRTICTSPLHRLATDGGTSRRLGKDWEPSATRKHRRCRCGTARHRQRTLGNDPKLTAHIVYFSAHHQPHFSHAGLHSRAQSDGHYVGWTSASVSSRKTLVFGTLLECPGFSVILTKYKLKKTKNQNGGPPRSPLPP